MERSPHWTRTPLTRWRRAKTLRPFGRVFLISGCLLQLPHDGVASTLGKVVEEAKKPVAEQEIVFRASAAREVFVSEENDGPSGVLETIALALDFFASLKESDSFEPYFVSPPSFESSEPSFVPPEHSEYPAPTRPGPLPSARHEPRFRVGISSLSVRPHDNVLSALDGGGFDCEAFLSPRVRFGMGLYRLQGQVREHSPAHGGIEAPWEFALDARTRMTLLGGGVLGMNGFVGIRYGELEWDYANPVYAIDEAGNAGEISKDSIANATVYFGIGLIPLQTRSLLVGVDFGTGFRGYFRETYEGFENDLFRDGWMTHLRIEIAIVF